MFYIGIFFFVFADLFTKFIAKNDLLVQKNLISDFLYLKYVENTGIAFGIPVTGILLKILTIVIIGIIFWYYLTTEKNKNNKLIDLSYILILSGGIGNGYERIFNSKVIDFIGIKYFSILNFADIFINLGVILYIVSFILLNKNKYVKS